MKALDLAAHVINRCMDLEKPVTHFKLQKILCLLDTNFMVNFGKRLIDDEFETTEQGPILRSVFDKYTYFAACDIKIRQNVSGKPLPKEYRNFILNTIDELANTSAWDMHVFLVKTMNNEQGDRK